MSNLTQFVGEDWNNLPSKPAVVAAGATQAAARAAIGAGTSNLALGATAGTALAGNTPVLPEAPSDGKIYGRKDAAWVEASSAGAGSGSGGAGLPDGGTLGQILAKASVTDQDVAWVDPPAGGGAGDALPSDNVSVTPTADKVPRARNDGTIDPDWLDDTDMQNKVADSIELTTLNAQTTGYTLALLDRGQTVTVDSSAPVTVTVPTAATVAFPVGTVVFVLQIGAGVVTIKGATGVTINGASAGSVNIADRWQGVSLLKVGSNTWVASGALA